MKLQVWHVKFVHMVFFFLLSGSLLYALFSGVFNHINRWTWIAFSIITIEFLILVIFRGKCPLTLLAEELGAANGRVSDIFFPRCISDKILHIYGGLFIVSCLFITARIF